MKENKKFYTLAVVALLTLAAYFLADTVDAVIGRSLDAAPKFTGPIGQERAAIEPRRELSDYSSILERGLFGEGKAPATTEGGGASASQPASSYTLVGTVEGAVFAGAVLQDATNAQTFYRIFQKLPDGSQIVKVLRDRVTLKRSDGTTSELQIVDDTKIVAVGKPTGPLSTGVKQISEGKYMVDQREIASSTENINQLLTQARALPYVEQGKTVGFRISEIVPGSIFAKIGIQNGDVIQRVNSQDVDDPGKFFQLYQGLREEKTISVDLLRNGQKQSLNYEIR